MDWFRSYHGAPFDPKFRVIAKASGARTGEVAAIFWALLDYASQAEKRGVTHSNALQRSQRFEEISAAFDFEITLIESVYCALEARGMIVDGTLISWEKRQPKREDNSANRVRAYRERVRETQRNADVTQCNSREEEIREEESRKKEQKKLTQPTAADPSGKLSETNEPSDLHAAYYRTGVLYLAKFGKDETAARKLLGLWSRDLGGFGAAGQALAQAQTICSPDPVAYMQGACEKLKTNRNAQRGHAKNGNGNSHTVVGFMHGSREWWEQVRDQRGYYFAPGDREKFETMYGAGK